MSSWSWSAQPNLIRAAQKDTFFVDTLVQELREAASLLMGPRRLANLQSEIDLVAAALYYGVQILERKTLGEEYCDLERVTTDWRLPSRPRLAGLVFLQVALPYLISNLRPSSSSSYSRLVSVLSSRTSVSTITRVNVAMFYLFGVYLHLSNRLLGVRYLQTVPAASSGSIYRLLGVLILAQMSISAGLHVYHQSRLNRSESVTAAAVTDSDDVACSPGPNCTLCLGPKRAPTVTDCGHVFCWICIASWCSNKPECPLCRQPVVLPNLVRLGNY